MKAAADVIAHPAKRHRAQGLHHHGERGISRLSRRSVFAKADTLVLAQQEQQFARTRKFRRIAKAAAARVERLLELLQRFRQRTFFGVTAVVLAARHHREAIDDLRSRLQDLRAIVTPGAADLREHVDEGRPPILGGRRIVGAAVERLQVGRQPHAHRPAAGAGRGLHERHVDPIDIRPLFAIDLDRNEQIVEDARHAFALERLALHHVAPMARRVADGKENRLARRLRSVERLRAPRIPVNRVVRMLQQVGGLLARETIGHLSMILAGASTPVAPC
jgi:hypothetical protein